MTTILTYNEQSTAPYRMLIEKDGKVIKDIRSSAIFGVSNDGDKGTTFVNFRTSNISAVICSLAQLREIEKKVLAKYPDFVQIVLRNAINKMSSAVEAAEVNENYKAVEVEINDDGIPFIKFEED